MEKNIIVFGATGNTGVEICKVLSSKQLKHSAFVRKGSEGKINTSSTNILAGDVFNKEEIEIALKSSDFTNVIVALGSRDLKADSVRSIGTKNIVEVLNQNNLNCKVHVVSAHGVSESWSRLKWHEKLLSKLFLGKTMKDHQMQEDAVKQNKGGYHIVRPVALKNGEATGKVIDQEGKLPNGDITRADVAEYMVESMLAGKSGASSVCRG